MKKHPLALIAVLAAVLAGCAATQKPGGFDESLADKKAPFKKYLGRVLVVEVAQTT